VNAILFYLLSNPDRKVGVAGSLSIIFVSN